MKNLAPLFIALLFALQAFSQVGINTTEPTATLDVNGNIRVRKMNSFTDSVAEKLVGMDEDGNFVLVDVDENVILEENKLRVVENRYRFASVIAIGDELNNMDLLILPGEPNDDKKVMRIYTPADGNFGSIVITGILAGEDGQTVWLFAMSGSIRLVGLNNGSDPENQFLLAGQITIQQYEMIQLLYDITLEKWLVMEH